jgi:hypothetical protein
MRSRLLAWAAGAVLLPLVGAGTAMADGVPGTQAVGQTAASQQAANADATSTQVNPSNQNISVRVLSPGDDGAVTQSNTSAATSAAANANAALQAAEQAAPAGSANQAAGQAAQSQQAANSDATSTQVKPTNQNVSVRVLSPGDDGSVSQSNDSSAAALAANANKTAQSAAQSAGGGSGSGAGGGSQAVGQAAKNDQNADADATSVQHHPSNVNAPTRVLSPGDGGKVEQSNTSAAKSAALNANKTVQKAAQDQGGEQPASDSGQKAAQDQGGEQPAGEGGQKAAQDRGGEQPAGEGSPPSCGCDHAPSPPCGCDHAQPATGIQAVGQKAVNEQSADADAKSVQVGAKNVNAPVRVLSPGKDGDVSQSNTSFAGAIAANKNLTGQFAKQAQGGLGPGAVGIQAIGQKAVNDQDADADAKSIQIGAKNINAPVRVFSPGGGGDVSQSNDSFAGALALNKNATGQAATQGQAGLGPGAVGIQAIGQEAFSEQDADADATSLQLFPTNVNAPVSLGDGKHSAPDGGPMKGGDSSVDQRNESTALAAALNANLLGQFALQV